MDLSASTWWWIFTGVAVAAELATGSFVLLMLAIGLGAGAVAAHLGLGLAGQLVAASLVGAAGVALWYVRRKHRTAAPPPSANRDVNLDIGQRVHVQAWQPDGTARVTYRGAEWTVRYAGPDTAAPGVHVIQRVEGNHLILGRPGPEA